jgi:three-Cys-motif partner protein
LTNRNPKTQSDENNENNGEVEYYESVGIHQKLKHKFIELYLKIWAENVGHNSKKNPPTVDFFDLFAASGLAHDKNTCEIWEGSALLAAKAFGEYPNGRLLFLNSFDENPEMCNNQMEILKRNIQNLEDCPHVSAKTRFFSADIHQATDEALRVLNKNYPSLWILDPYHPNQLPWKIIERIGSTLGRPYTDKKTGKTVSKKPELIINLMTSVLQRNIGRKPELLSNAIGLSHDNWLPLYEKYEEKWKLRGVEQCTRHVILDIYAERLSQLYKKPPIVAEVNAAEGGIVYTMFLVTDSDAGYFNMKKKMADWHNYKIYQWKPEAKLSTFKKKNQSQEDLTKWF